MPRFVSCTVNVPLWGASAALRVLMPGAFQAPAMLDEVTSVDGEGSVSFVVRLDQERVNRASGVVRGGTTTLAALEPRVPYLTLRLVALPKP